MIYIAAAVIAHLIIVGMTLVGFGLLTSLDNFWTALTGLGLSFLGLTWLASKYPYMTLLALIIALGYLLAPYF